MHFTGLGGAVPLAHQTSLLCFQEQFAVLKSHGSFSFSFYGSTRCRKGKNGKEGKKGKQDEREKRLKKSCCAML